MPITGPFDQANVKGHNSALVRKMLEMSVYLAPWETTSAISTIVNTSNLLVIPDLFESVGIMDKQQGASVSPKLTIDETSGYGYGAPIRRDVVSRINSIQFTMIESKRRAFEAYNGVDLSGTVGSSIATGKQELTWTIPDLPAAKYWRVLCLARDGGSANALYHAEFFPRATLTDVNEMKFSDNDPLAYAITMGVDTDSTAGYPQRSFWAGPALSTQLMSDMGFSRAA